MVSDVTMSVKEKNVFSNMCNSEAFSVQTLLGTPKDPKDPKDLQLTIHLFLISRLV